MCEDEERAFGREHAYLCSRHFGNVMAPDACCIDDYLCSVFCCLAGFVVEDFYAGDSVLFAQKFCNFRIYKDFRSMEFGVNYV